MFFGYINKRGLIMLEEIINIVFGILLLGVLGILCQGAMLIVNDREREFWKRRRRGTCDGNDSRSESKEEGS